MVVRQIGEQRAVECDPVDAPLIEAVRRNFHRHRLRAPGFEFGEQAVQFERVRRGIRHLGKRARKTAAQRSDHACLDFLQGKNMSQPMRAGSLAVGAGDATDPERLRGAAVELVREEARLRFEVFHRRVRHAPAAVPGKAFAFPHHRRAAELDRLGDVAPAIRGPARPGEERRPDRGAPAVGGETFDHCTLAREQRENVVNYVFSFASSPSPGSSIGASGASCGAPSRRSAPCITCANTGAATWPP